MAKKHTPKTPDEHLSALLELLNHFKEYIHTDKLRDKVLGLIPAHTLLRGIGTSLMGENKSSARERILLYLQKYQGVVIDGNELMIVAGISEYARRIRELRVQYGWKILSGRTVNELREQNEEGSTTALPQMKPSEYVLVDPNQDRDSAHRWNIANSIRKQSGSVRDKILLFFRKNVSKEVSGEELRYVAGDKTEWARRVRELRTEYGWPIVTQATGRPDLPVGVYVLEEDRQAPEHDRTIRDDVRGAVLRRDHYTCQDCRWNRSLWNRDDPRHLEVHHVTPHAEGGANSADNLITLCNTCHDARHRR